MPAMTWEDELSDYILNMKAKGLSKGYIANGRSYLRRLGEATDPDSFLDLKEKQIYEWFIELREKGRSEATMKTVVTRLKAFLRWLNEGETPTSVRGLKMGGSRSRVKSREELLSPEELERLLKVSTLDKRCIMRLLSKCGRPSDILNLRREDVVFKRENGRRYAELTFPNTKNGQPNVVPVVDSSALDELEDWLEIAPQEGYLFPSPLRPGQPIGHQALWRYMRAKAKAAGITKRVYPYLLRHGRATELAKVPRAHADKVMGWTSGVMWKNYTHLQTDDVRDVLFEMEGPASSTMTEDEAKEILGRLLVRVSEDPALAEKLREFLG